MLELLEERKKEEKALQEKYRDRAKERRQGLIDAEQEAAEAYMERLKAIAQETADDDENVRLKLIEESKFLGGDVEHTHLVKGLDFALLEKMQAEQEQQKQMNRPSEAPGEVVTAERPKFKTALARGVYDALFTPANEQEIQRNELFEKGRMAYVMSLGDEGEEVPPTVLRSKASLPQQRVLQESTSDIVVNKLIAILAEIRQGQREEKRKKREAAKQLKEQQQKEKELLRNPAAAAAAAALAPDANVDIFDDVGDYNPEAAQAASADSTAKPRLKDSYFDVTADEKEEETPVDAATVVQNILKVYDRNDEEVIDTDSADRKRKKKMDMDSYGEYFPDQQGAYFSDEDEGGRDESSLGWKKDFQQQADAKKAAEFKSKRKAAKAEKTDKATAKEEKALNREINDIGKILHKRGAKVEDGAFVKKAKGDD
eukprot:m.66705 g.66705  ORF g.66705 m.66705 type:complete len:429 (+) comp16580_c0_seq2:250-1536(+)